MLILSCEAASDESAMLRRDREENLKQQTLLGWGSETVWLWQRKAPHRITHGRRLSGHGRVPEPSLCACGVSAAQSVNREITPSASLFSHDKPDGSALNELASHTDTEGI